MGITTISQDLFPEVDKIMAKYLIPQILSAERMEMSQCLYFVPSKAEPNIAEVFSVLVMSCNVNEI
jgi:hypothetical protein